MTIDCAIDIGWIRDGEMQYGAKVDFALPAAVGASVVAVAVLESVLFAFREMEHNATEDDRRDVQEKMLNISVRRGEQTAAFSLNHKRNDSDQDASDAVIDWVCGDTVRGVVE